MDPSSNLAIILETSTRVGIIALAEGSSILVRDTLTESMKHARDLTRKLADLFEQVGRKANEASRVVVSLGPGSYTALRVGVMAAKMLAYVNSCPLHGIPTFRAIAEQTPCEDTVIEVIADALQGELYAQRFQRMGEATTPRTELTIIHRDKWLSQLHPGTCITGPGVSLFSSGIPGMTIIPLDAAQQPTPEQMLRIVQSDPSTMVDPWTVEPIYLRGSSAEEKRKQAHSTGGVK